MTVDIQQRPFHDREPTTIMSSKSKLGASSSSHRLPLQARNPNAMGGGGSTTFNTCSTEEYNSKDTGTSNLNRLSTLESSNNENNNRVTNSTANSNGSASNVRRGSATSEPREQQEQPARSSSVPRGALSRSSSLPTTTMDEDSIIIEEKRKRANGEGFTLHRYLRGRLLGKGGFAKVYLCTALDTNKAYAVKVVPKANLVKTRARQKLQAEIKIHRTLKHRHVCEYKHFFEDRQNCYILLELCHNQSMNEMIKRRKRLTEPETTYIMRQLLEAMHYLHDQLVIHRDLKLGNLFLDRNLNIKVGDLGLASRLENAEEKRKTICGTPNYIAPEVIQGDRAARGHSFEVDVWSMGVILYTCLVGKPPYEAKDVKATYQRIIANEYSFPRDIPISDEAKDIIQKMLQSRPEDRPSLNEIAGHPFFTESKIPYSLPSNATHVAPIWRENDFGELVAVSKAEAAAEKDTAVPKKPCLPLGSSQRRVFASRDVNVERGSERSEHSKTSKSSKGSRDMFDVPNAVKNVVSSVMNVGNRSPHAASSAPVPKAALPPAPAAFQVFDESQAAPEVRKTSHRKLPQSRPVEDELVTRTASLSIRTQEQTPYQTTYPSPRQPLATPPAGSVTPENDSLILHNMIDRIDTVLQVSATREYSSVNANSPSLTAFSRGGPTRWVSRYVDYTSKYGLGFLLNNGSSGVYFNDSTKTVLEAEGDSFQYVERKRIAGDSISGTRRGEPVVELFTLTDYPDKLQKKVTLLKHFRNYLFEQQKKTDEDDYGWSNTTSTSSSSRQKPMVYLKKWVRTKHAIFFRLSDSTVQIVFYDHTEVLLTSDERHITYVDKQRNRSTYYLTDELVGCIPEIAKRLRYTKEILQQLVAGQKR